MQAKLLVVDAREVARSIQDDELRQRVLDRLLRICRELEAVDHAFEHARPGE